MPKLKPRRDPSGEEGVNRVDFAELTPPLDAFLGQAAYLQLSLFEILTRAVATAPTTQAKETLSRVAGKALGRHHALVALIERGGRDAAETMAPFARRIDDFHRITLGEDWHELLVSSYITSGILDDFFVRLGDGLPGEIGAEVRRVLADDGRSLIVDELRHAIDADPRLASRLALWARRLVGDTLLVARSALAVPVLDAPEEARLEPVFTELIAAHTRRMDVLGLTA